MLCLSRKAGEDIVIGEGIIVRVVSIVGGKVRIGIVCDRSIPVDRGEIRAAKLADAKEALQCSPKP